ncbi:MAG: UMP kinase [Candidatus Magasanikbacteria bacterium]|nr:UMP kinase [Candidatus Magasanikbacteria bacterium]
MRKNEIIVLSLGGSLIIPKDGFNLEFLKGFKKLILKFVKKGARFIIVCGGGHTARAYQDISKGIGELTPEDIDWIGIHSTRLNAHFMRTIFRKWAHSVVVKDPTHKLQWTEKILVGSGWKPGWSTDYDAVKLAELYGAKTVINLSNVEYVCDKDPKKFADAKKLEKISWAGYRKIVGDKWSPGANWPFDPVASKEAEKMKLKVIVMDGTNLTEVEKAIGGKRFKGTTII